MRATGEGGQRRSPPAVPRPPGTNSARPSTRSDSRGSGGVRRLRGGQPATNGVRPARPRPAAHRGPGVSTERVRLSSTGKASLRRAKAPLAAVRRIAPQLDGSVLPVQGPPGSGRTYTGARMLLDPIAGGKRVGVTANSHKVISNLLTAVCDATSEHACVLFLR